MKKILAILLAALMLMAGTAAVAETYDTPVAFSMSCRNVSANYDWDSDALYKYITDKFNLDIDIWAVDASSQDETGSCGSWAAPCPTP